MTERRFISICSVCAAACSLALSARADNSPFATRVISYDPAPGQQVNSVTFNDPTKALGAPRGGGTAAPNNTKIATLGGFGGSITLGFDHTILRHPPTDSNPFGLDAIVFGNAFFVGANPSRRWAEAGVIEISRDRGDGQPGTWYVIRGSHLPAAPSTAWTSQTWDDNTADATNPPALSSWLPPGHSGTWTTSTYLLPSSVFHGPVVLNPLGDGASAMGIQGYADCSPTLILGDLDGDNIVDDDSIPPEEFYTRPSDPFSAAITPGSGGGDAFSMSWAVDPTSGAPANLDGFDYLRITTAVSAINGALGEVSTEISGVAEVVIIPSSTCKPNTLTGSGCLGPTDLLGFLGLYFTNFDGLGSAVPGNDQTSPQLNPSSSIYAVSCSGGQLSAAPPVVTAVGLKADYDGDCQVGPTDLLGFLHDYFNPADSCFTRCMARKAPPAHAPVSRSLAGARAEGRKQ